MAQQPQSDPWVEAAKSFKPSAAQGMPASQPTSDDWKIWQQGSSDTADTRNQPQKNFDQSVQVNPSDPLWAFGLKNLAAGFGNPIFHPIQTLESMNLGKQYEAAKAAGPQPMSGLRDIVGQGAQALGGMALGAMTGAIGAKVLPAIRGVAIGNPDVAALKGLQVSPTSPRSLTTLRSVEGARPFLKGAQSLEDLQARIGPAKESIWGPYKETIDAIGDRPVQGPNGMSTIRDLENERLQVSALLRDLKAKTPNPESIQLAEQKGLNQAQLISYENRLKVALDPQLRSAGIDPKAIRRAFGDVSQIGTRISGKSTLAEAPERYGFGKIANLSVTEPLQAPAQVGAGLRDILAGRPLWSGKPTDIAIREAFRKGGPQPLFGRFQPQRIKGLLPTPMEDILLHDPFAEPNPSQSVFDAPISGSRTGEPMTTPEGNPNYGYSDRSPELPPTKGILQRGTLRRRAK